MSAGRSRPRSVVATDADCRPERWDPIVAHVITRGARRAHDELGLSLMARCGYLLPVFYLRGDEVYRRGRPVVECAACIVEGAAWFADLQPGGSLMNALDWHPEFQDAPGIIP